MKMKTQPAGLRDAQEAVRQRGYTGVNIYILEEEESQTNKIKTARNQKKKSKPNSKSVERRK